MARRPNYGAEKRQKEIKRQQKQEEKAEKKRLKREEARTGDVSAVPEEGEPELEAGPDEEERE